MSKKNKINIKNINYIDSDPLRYVLKNNFGMTYKDIPDEKYKDVINYIEFLKQNPN